MSEGTVYKSHFKEYMVIFVLLTVLTVIEVVIPSMDALSTFQKGSSLTLLAFGKAFLVAYFYMHLKEETKVLKWIAAVPMSAVVYAAFNMLEAYYR